MRFKILLIFLFSIFAQAELKISSDSSFLKDLQKLKNQKEYKEFTTRIVKSSGSFEALNKFEKLDVNFAVVRGDILGIKNNNLYGFTPFKNYGILGQLEDTYLFLISKIDISSIYDLRGKAISIGSVENLAQVYMEDIARNAGILLNLNFKSIEKGKSLKALKSDKIDAIFLFAKKDYMKRAINNGFKIQSMPEDFLRFLTKSQGLIKTQLKVDNKTIETFKVPNFVIAPKDYADPNFNKMLESVIYTFKSTAALQATDIFYGQLHPKFVESLINVKLKRSKELKLDDKKNGILVRFVDKLYQNNKTKFLYSVIDNTDYDANLSFSHFKTDDFDEMSIKPRHVLKVLPEVLNLKPKTERIFSITYSNEFTNRINANVDIILKDNINLGNYITIPIVIGDNW